VDIYQAEKLLVCTCRHEGLKHTNLRILRNAKGGKVVATDPVGVNEGNWVFTASGSAARFASGDFEILTDLTVAGIIDFWDAE